MSENQFTKRMASLSDEELLNVIKLRDEYQPEAVIAAKKVAISRKLIDENYNLTNVSDEVKDEHEIYQIKEKKRKENEEKKRKQKPIRIIVIIAILISAFFIYRWYSGKQQVREVELEIHTQLEKEFNYSVNEVSLVHESGNKYKGMVTLDDGSEMPIEVIIDDEKYYFELK